MSNFTPAWFKKGFFNESRFCDDHEQLLLLCDLLPEMFFTFFSIMREL